MIHGLNRFLLAVLNYTAITIGPSLTRKFDDN